MDAEISYTSLVVLQHNPDKVKDTKSIKLFAAIGQIPRGNHIECLCIE